MENIIRIRDLAVRFHTYEGVVHAIDDLDLDIRQGETLGIVGETGSGKTMTALAILRLIPYPGRIESGSIAFFDTDLHSEIELLKLSEDNMRSIRGDKISMVFQEPGAALNPVYTIGDQISEVFLLHRRPLLGKRAKEQVDRLLRDGDGFAAGIKRPFWRWQRRLYNKIAQESNPFEARFLSHVPLFRRLLWRLKNESKLLTVDMLKDVEIPDADRVARKSPVLQVAVKNAGAIHSADIIINFNA